MTRRRSLRCSRRRATRPTSRARSASTRASPWPGSTTFWTRGTRLPILVGIPGIVPRAKLLRVSTRIGIGESLRYLRKHGDFVTRFLQPGGFNPDRLIKGLAPALATSEQRVGGFHIFTFNDLADTEAWRQRSSRRLT